MSKLIVGDVVRMNTCNTSINNLLFQIDEMTTTPAGVALYRASTNDHSYQGREEAFTRINKFRAGDLVKSARWKDSGTIDDVILSKIDQIMYQVMFEIGSSGELPEDDLELLPKEETKQMKFKVGDEVKVTIDRKDMPAKGSIVTIDRVDANENLYYVKLYHIHYIFRENEIEAADTVRIKPDWKPLTGQLPAGRYWFNFFNKAELWDISDPDSTPFEANYYAEVGNLIIEPPEKEVTLTITCSESVANDLQNILNEKVLISLKRDQ